jgi:hypothetical protein
LAKERLAAIRREFGVVISEATAKPQQLELIRRANRVPNVWLAREERNR